MRIPKTARNIMISVLVLMVLFGVGGVAYTLFMDQRPNTVPTSTASLAPAYSAPIKPAKPSSKAPEGVAVESVTSPISLGSSASIYARTNSGSACTITVTYSNGAASHDPGLAPKKADAYGSVAWSWVAGPPASLGAGLAKISCVYHGRSGVVQADLSVTNS